MSWTLGLSSATVGLITSFTDQLFADGLVDKVLNLLDKIDVEKEIDNLSKGRAVGGLRHRQQLVELIQEQRTCLADCLFYWACQNPLPKEATLKLLRYLKKVKLSDDGGSSSTVPSIFGPPPSSSSSFSSSPPKPLDPVVLSLFHTLLACFNIGDVLSGEDTGTCVGGGVCILIPFPSPPLSLSPLSFLSLFLPSFFSSLFLPPSLPPFSPLSPSLSPFLPFYYPFSLPSLFSMSPCFLPFSFSSLPSPRR